MTKVLTVVRATGRGDPWTGRPQPPQNWASSAQSVWQFKHLPIMLRDDAYAVSRLQVRTGPLQRVFGSAADTPCRLTQFEILGKARADGHRKAL